MILRRRPEDEVGMQIAPMVDITWIMIIFFMVTNQIVENEFDVPIELPIASAAEVPKDATGRVIINLDENGTFHVGSEPTDLAGLTAHLTRRMIEHPPLKVYLRADANTPAQRTKEFYKACAEAGAVEVVLGTFNAPN
jgi:biopolymer transport protein ExbD